MNSRSGWKKGGLPLNTLKGILWGTLVALPMCLIPTAEAQIVSPLQGGHYSPAVANIRDLATPPPGLFVLWYNAYATSSEYIDRDGNKFNSIRLDQIYPGLPNVDVSLKLKAISSIPTVFWASPFTVLGGARYMAGFSLTYISADASIVTERGGIIIDTTYTRAAVGKNSGFSDMLVVPLGLSWEMEGVDLTFMYGFTAPTGKYETGSSENLGLGFWTHQFQGYGYLYPMEGKATAVMLGVTYELNSKIQDADVQPGGRFSLAWGISQYFSEQFELGIQGGHNWQISDDSGQDVYWDSGIHDRKSTLAFAANYWVLKEHLSLNLKYAFDFGARQRFLNNTWLLNVVFVPGILTGK